MVLYVSGPMTGLPDRFLVVSLDQSHSCPV